MSACVTAPRRWPSAWCLRGVAPARRRSSAPSSCRTSTKARCGFARRCPTRSRSRRRRSWGPSSARCCSRFPQVTTVANELGRPDDGTDPIGFFNDEYLRRAQAVQRSGLERRHPHEGSSSRRRSSEKLEAFPGHHLQLHAAGRGCRRRGGNRPQELAGREDLRVRSGDARGQGRGRPQGHCRRPRHRGHHPRARARATEPHDRAGPREDRAVRAERRRHQHADRDRGRRQRRRPR